MVCGISFNWFTIKVTSFILVWDASVKKELLVPLVKKEKGNSIARFPRFVSSFVLSFYLSVSLFLSLFFSFSLSLFHFVLNAELSCSLLEQDLDRLNSIPQNHAFTATILYLFEVALVSQLAMCYLIRKFR